MLVFGLVLWRENFVEGIIGNDHGRRNAREWKGREMVGTWKENAIERRLEQSRNPDGTDSRFVEGIKCYSQA
jgi:hypothetical protein